MFAAYLVDPLTEVNRVDESNLPQHTLMELFVQDSPKKPDWMMNADGSFTDISQWNGLQINKKQEIWSIFWMNQDCSVLENLNIQWLPQSLSKLTLEGMSRWKSTLATSDLPRALHELRISKTALSGIIDTHGLPRTMWQIFLRANHFSGTIDWTGWPPKMHSINISANEFEGEVSLGSLPKGMRCLNIVSNTFRGTLDMTNIGLPVNLRVNFSDNPFTGRISFEKTNLIGVSTPDGVLNEISLEGTQFSEIVWESVPERAAFMYLNKSNQSGSLPVERIPRHLQWFWANFNNYSGSIELKDLPPVLSHFHAISNEFSGTIDIVNACPALIDLRLSDNHIQGPIALANLPMKVEYLLLCNNDITQDVLVIDVTPESLQKIDLRGNEIGQVKCDKHLFGKVLVDDSSRRCVVM